ncbi:MAG: VWA domain-containing protein [Gammaproteobacteria bacterium]|nr:VWA domain-containing protein [Gammaproteobacteria bacterium]
MPEWVLLRPAWLLALPPLAWLVWRLYRGGTTGSPWHRWIDRRLVRHVVADPAAGRRPRLALATALAALAAVTALTGPAWERAPQPLFRGDSALVIVLDLSRSMDVEDVAPSRVARARLKLADLLARRPADQLGLVVYTANAFTVAPLTADTATLTLLLPALSSAIMPSQGSHPSLGLEKAAELLDQAGLRRGELLLVTDSAGGPETRELVIRLAARGLVTSVLAVGTAEGGPIPLADGSLLRDRQGRIVMPTLDEAALRRLAAAGEGRFARLSADDSDLDHLLAPLEGRAPRAAIEAEGRGPWRCPRRRCRGARCRLAGPGPVAGAGAPAAGAAGVPARGADGGGRGGAHPRPGRTAGHGACRGDRAGRHAGTRMAGRGGLS